MDSYDKSGNIVYVLKFLVDVNLEINNTPPLWAPSLLSPVTLVWVFNLSATFSLSGKQNWIVTTYKGGFEYEMS